MPARDIIVVGASAGGYDAIQRLVSGLPRDLPAAMFVTLHQLPGSLGFLPQVLTRAGALPAVHAADGMPVEMGTIYVSPPDYHVVIQNGFMQLSHGPRENLQRPCINVMFRSAATAYGERVAGVLLTGLLDDGAAGLWDIQQHGGATVVQDPEEATFRSMPDSAIRGLNVQYIMRLQEIAPLLVKLSSGGHGGSTPRLAETWIEPAGQVCPECGGVMTKAHLGGLLEYRCHIGHRYGLKSLIAQKNTVVENALGQALSQSEELVRLLRTAAENGAAKDLEGIEEEIARAVDEQEAMRELLARSRGALEAVGGD